MGLSVYSFVYAKSSVDFQNTNHLSLSQMQQKIREQDERIDGLSSVIEGLSATLHKLETRECSTVVSAVSKTDDTLLQKLAKMIDDIHADYVSKDELSRVLSMKEKKPLPAPVKIKKRLDAKKSKVLYSEGVRYFVKQRYNEAKKRFLLTESQNYKPAASNYYLGEISYYTKQYEDAIFYFKKSAGLYDKATYIDTLILHTAISLDKTGQKKQAKVFYKNIIENYKGKKTAKIATDRLRKL
ncbi:TPR repeat containing exported protein; Putative periplasmic protein contains a protein prenylyltransferase domain [hydrothermal vent metagenome]|uniref:TPR repeat containing exported protein Putative periplasmic protein contains a protein prenylyltransferase domain n=1 Tax=hydrothermal vent metagenome TaxID=652676 RepID=A0A1W1BD38_9ZZZZ